jgi:tetrahydromethanopterin S-methyltransferase subunit G
MVSKFTDKTIDYKQLMTVPVSQRVDLLRNDTGRQLLLSLTPDEIARAFPRSYSNIDTGVSEGMRLLRDAASGGTRISSPTERDLRRQNRGNLPSYERVRSDPADSVRLSREKQEVYELLKKNNQIAADDPRLKFLEGVSNDELKRYGIVKKSVDGKELYSYTPTEASRLSREEVIERNKDVSPGTGDLTGRAQLVKKTYDAFREAGLSDKQARAVVAEVNRENSFNPVHMFGTHGEIASHVQGRTNYGIFSWGDPTRVRNFKQHMQSNGVMDGQGRIIADRDTYLKQQARFAVSEMRQTTSGQSFLENREITQNEGIQALGRHIGWDMAGRRHDANSSYARLQEGRRLIDDINSKMPNLLPSNATPEQIELARTRLGEIENQNRGQAFTQRFGERVRREIGNTTRTPRSSEGLEETASQSIYSEMGIRLTGGAAQRGYASSLNNMNPELMGRYHNAIQSLPPEIRQKIQVSSAYRDPNDPAHRAEYERRQRTPGSSPMADPRVSRHGAGEVGNALDTVLGNLSNEERKIASDAFRRNGLRAPVSREGFNDSHTHLELDPAFEGEPAGQRFSQTVQDRRQRLAAERTASQSTVEGQPAEQRSSQPPQQETPAPRILHSGGQYNTKEDELLVTNPKTGGVEAVVQRGENVSMPENTDDVKVQSRTQAMTSQRTNAEELKPTNQSIIRDDLIEQNAERYEIARQTIPNNPAENSAMPNIKQEIAQASEDIMQYSSSAKRAFESIHKFSGAGDYFNQQTYS